MDGESHVMWNNNNFYSVTLKDISFMSSVINLQEFTPIQNNIHITHPFNLCRSSLNVIH